MKFLTITAITLTVFTSVLYIIKWRKENSKNEAGCGCSGD